MAPTFAELGASPEIVASLAASGIERAFPIQAMTLPLALEGRDLIGQAKTGTGKTLGYLKPRLVAAWTQRAMGVGEAAAAGRLSAFEILWFLSTALALGIAVPATGSQAGTTQD